MQFWKDHKALRLTLILVFFAAGLTLVCVGWAMTGKLGGLLLMLVGLVLLLSALLVYNKAFEDPSPRAQRRRK